MSSENVSVKPPVFPLHYFGNLYYYALLLKHANHVLDIKENYVKQSYRSRTLILGSNGPLKLVVPVVKKPGVRQKMDEICISYEEDWIGIHWKSITSAYRTSPYFEYYEAQFEELFNTKPKLLKDFNIAAHQLICKVLNLDFELKFTNKYESILEEELDYRSVLSPKMKNLPQILSDNKYIQVFSDRFPFYSNLSVLDLIFNEGPNSAFYLENIGLAL